MLIEKRGKVRKGVKQKYEKCDRQKDQVHYMGERRYSHKWEIEWNAMW